MSRSCGSDWGNCLVCVQNLTCAFRNSSISKGLKEGLVEYKKVRLKIPHLNTVNRFRYYSLYKPNLSRSASKAVLSRCEINNKLFFYLQVLSIFGVQTQRNIFYFARNAFVEEALNSPALKPWLCIIAARESCVSLRAPIAYSQLFLRAMHLHSVPFNMSDWLRTHWESLLSEILSTSILTHYWRYKNVNVHTRCRCEPLLFFDPSDRAHSFLLVIRW